MKTKADKLNKNDRDGLQNGTQAVAESPTIRNGLNPLCPVEGVLAGAQTALSYENFLQSKSVTVPSRGPIIPDSAINPILFPFQRVQVVWGTRKARCALFDDTGLGKTFMGLEWGRLICGGNKLYVGPRSVIYQAIGEAQKLGISLEFSRDGAPHPMTMTNYEMISKFNPDDFEAVILDESSILKSLDGKTRGRLIDMFRDTPYRLCCTATPAPNDIAEIANHAEFLGIMTRVDMLATFFVHDDEGWRLKGHAEEPFYRWLASWAMSVRRPSDLGFEDTGYVLPGLDIEPVFVESDFQPDGTLFFTKLKGITDRSRVRRGTLKDRVIATADMVNADSDQWLIWCGLNPESEMLTAQIPDAVEVKAARKPEEAEERARIFEDFQNGKIRVIVTKPKIAGFGMNFQNCHKMAFVGLSDSWEAYYQCIRRCYRFGQTEPVKAYIVLSEAERSIYDNVQRKEKEATDMAEKLVKNVREFEKAEITAGTMAFEYKTQTEQSERWKIMLGDSAERFREVESESLDLSVFSPPFMSLYTYSPTERDLGNSRDEATFFKHFAYIIPELLRATKPGRNCCVHVSQVPAMLVRDGYIGLKDFRGKTIIAFESAGWIYHGEVIIDKDPQAQAIRTKSKALAFAQLHKDGSWLRPALADFILVFRKPGVNAVPVIPDITNEQWIEWARPIWYNISETDTLNVAEGRTEKDERHICALQLETIERCIRLWSNKGELVASTFAGIGSEGYEAIKLGRRFVGCELNPAYFPVTVKNLKRAEAEFTQDTLFPEIPDAALSEFDAFVADCEVG